MNYNDLERIETLWHSNFKCYHKFTGVYNKMGIKCNKNLFLVYFNGEIHCILCENHYNAMEYDRDYRVGILTEKDIFTLKILSK